MQRHEIISADFHAESVRKYKFCNIYLSIFVIIIICNDDGQPAFKDTFTENIILVNAGDRPRDCGGTVI